jgi:hypothetical protein
MMRLWVGLLVLGAAVAGGQSMGRIEGRVLTTSGAAVGKAEVVLQLVMVPVPPQEDEYRLEISDSAGKFSFEEVPPGTYTLLAEKSGFSSAASRGDADAKTIELRPGEVKTGIEIKLTPQGVISGHVIDPDGDPAPNIQVEVVVFRRLGRQRQPVPQGMAVTDDQGNFRIQSVSPGRYYLRAQYPGNGSRFAELARRGRSAQEVYTPTFYPSALDLSGAETLDVRPGAELHGISIRMRKTRVFSIRGKAVDSRSGNGCQCFVELGTNSTQAHEDGTFELRNVPPGSHILIAEQGALPPGVALAGRTDVEVRSADVDRVVVRVSPMIEINGVVRLEDGDLKALMADTGGTIELHPFGGEGFEEAAMFSRDGTFLFEHVWPSKYRASVDKPPPGTYAKSIRLGGRELTKSTLDLTSGAGGVLELILSQRTAEMTIKVRGGNAGTVVAIWPKERPEDDPAAGIMSFIGAVGDLKATGVAPGEYYVAAWEEIDSALAGDPDFLALFEREASLVKVRESDSVSLEVGAIRKDKVAAEVAKLP